MVLSNISHDLRSSCSTPTISRDAKGGERFAATTRQTYPTASATSGSCFSPFSPLLSIASRIGLTKAEFWMSVVRRNSGHDSFCGVLLFCCHGMAEIASFCGVLIYVGVDDRSQSVQFVKPD